MVQWLRFCASTAGGTGLIPGQGTKIPHVSWCDKTNKQTKNKSLIALWLAKQVIQLAYADIFSIKKV